MAETFSQSAAGTTILKGVSRSFYLSLRLLPSSMRDAAGLAYLLARSSDTIADAPHWDVASRLQCLDEFHRAIHGSIVFSTPNDLLEQCNDGEKILMNHVQEHLRWLETLTDAERLLVHQVLDEIISGQRLDLIRFADAREGCRMVLANDAELIDYCQRVAGSVGEFWTKLGFLREGNRFTDETEETMVRWGRNFGCALQLVNILRDRPDDMRHGRYYLPGTVGLNDDEACLHAQDRWLAQAKSWVHEGMSYAQALHGRRLRCATALPALLALETIEALEQATWPQMQQRIKVSRATVFRCLAEALLC
jgi:farnesyl-diphosphate farnesyltransferase